MKNIKWSNIIYIIVVLIIAIVMILKNLKSPSFWDANLIQILTLTLTAIISFFFVQKLTDKRRKIDYFERILDEIQTTINNDDTIFSVGKEAVNLQTSVSNKLKHLNDHSFSKIKNELNYINNEFIELRELYDNHRQTKEKLIEILPDINRHKQNISDKINKIRLMLYEI